MSLSKFRDSPFVSLNRPIHVGSAGASGSWGVWAGLKRRRGGWQRPTRPQEGRHYFSVMEKKPTPPTRSWPVWRPLSGFVGGAVVWMTGGMLLLPDACPLWVSFCGGRLCADLVSFSFLFFCAVDGFAFRDFFPGPPPSPRVVSW